MLHKQHCPVLKHEDINSPSSLPDLSLTCFSCSNVEHGGTAGGTRAAVIVSSAVCVILHTVYIYVCEEVSCMKLNGFTVDSVPWPYSVHVGVGA